MSPAPTLFDQPTQADVLKSLPRKHVAALARLVQSTSGDEDAVAWATYAEHLIGVIAGYEQAVANLTEPPSNGTDTSDNAARTIRPGVNAIRARILSAIADSGKGHTVRWVERTLEMSHGTASARVHEMVKIGYLADTGLRAITTQSPTGGTFTGRVYDLTEMGRDLLTQHRTSQESATP